MHRLVLAIRIFFRTLFHADVAANVERLLSGATAAPTVPQQPVPPAATPPVPKKEPSAPPPPPSRNDGLILLATLQREARFVDFVKEPIGAYSDAQIGAAVRDIHRDCGKVLDRLFGLEAVLPDAEGAEVEVPADADRFRLTGNVHGNPPYRGQMTHHGWRATKYDIPVWTGSTAAAKIVAPAEIEMK